MADAKNTQRRQSTPPNGDADGANGTADTGTTPNIDAANAGLGGELTLDDAVSAANELIASGKLVTQIHGPLGELAENAHQMLDVGSAYLFAADAWKLITSDGEETLL
ncbi:hypothetical protein HQ393_04945 [Chitinibacter bivalviorum]|uniref:Uncharacterized protein n=1 Tax=Chitinibacter bivalviorum TaxID=2739434 RepID=A0A7H9BG18_9NEIS|nr:hypothetical protein [Chitinibacter bivalviorum]QLG87653.1 hypothetical protein HQ393_04945 [Chitinibacter bivalviorum]